MGDGEESLNQSHADPSAKEKKAKEKKEEESLTQKDSVKEKPQKGKIHH